ncbi:MAG TPA: hypothetical protein VMJ12_13930 [Candidatus Acidoferrales bacterium]|nr:hypothetical protein [Candidatus Acidoferrales bacterium]
MNRPNTPEELAPGKYYSFRTEMKVNGWCWAAVLSSFAGECWLLPHHTDWPVALRTVIALVPLVASLLWVRSVAGWVRGMDELHRRITIAACLFATVATLFVVAALHFLVTAGVIPAHFHATAGFVIIWLVVCFYILGQTIFNRRYR